MLIMLIMDRCRGEGRGGGVGFDLLFFFYHNPHYVITAYSNDNYEQWDVV